MQEGDSMQHAGQGHGHPHRFDEIVLPAPTPWPLVLAFGLNLMIAGMVTHWVISLLGLVLVLRSMVGWFLDMFPHEQHISVPIRAGIVEISSTRTTREKLPIGENHRKLLPIETFSVIVGHQGRHHWRRCDDHSSGALWPYSLQQHLVCGKSARCWRVCQLGW